MLVGLRPLATPPSGHLRERLTRRARVDRVEPPIIPLDATHQLALVDQVAQQCDRVVLNELERIPRLGYMIDAHDFEARA